MALLTWLLVTVLAGVLARRLQASPAPWVALAAWVSLPIYNHWVLAGCPGDCAIRVDLLIVLPVLAGVSLWVLVHGVRQYRRRRRP